MTVRRIGIYAGSFNPVHAGHVALALQAVEQAQLDRLYFLPERQPRNKRGVEHFGHRVGMLQRALLPHPKLHVLELPDINLSVQRTLTRLQYIFGDDQLVFLFGSDQIPELSNWPLSQRMLIQSELAIGLRTHETAEQLSKIIQTWDCQPQKLTVIDSYAPTVSSSQIREALRLRKQQQGLLPSVAHYSDRHWLYVSLA